MVMTPIFFIVRIPRESSPAQDWEEQAYTCCCQSEQDPDPDCDRHAEKHPKKAHFIMAFVDVTEPRNNAEHCCDFIVRMFLFSAEWR